MKVRFCVVGMKYNDASPADFSSYDSFRIVPEPENKFDKNALAVYGGEKKLGHVSREYISCIPMAIRKSEEGVEFTPLEITKFQSSVYLDVEF